MMRNYFNRLPRGVKASVAFFIASVVSKGISYLTTPIFTRLLSSEEYGQVSIFLTWFQIFGIIAMFCFAYGIFNNGMIEYKDKRDDFSFSLLILSNIFTIAFAGILFSIFPFIQSFIKIEIPFIFLMCLLFLFQPAYNFWFARQRYELKYKATLAWTLVCAIVSPFVAIVCILFSKDGDHVYMRIFGAECPLLLIYIGFYLYLGFKNRWQVNTQYWKEAILFNLPLIPHYLSTYLLGSSDKIMISYLIGDTAVAYYSVASSIGTIAGIIWTAINGSLIPYTYEKCEEGKYEDINRVTLPLISLFAVGCFVVILLAPEAVRLMATNNYMEAIYVIPPIVGGVFFQIQYFIYANIVYYHKKPTYVMIGSLTAVILNLVLNYFCIKNFGYIAAGYTTIVCYAVQASIDYLAMRIVVGKAVYNMKYIFILSLCVVVIVLLSNLIYNSSIIRYMILILTIVLIIIFRKKIIKIVFATKNVKSN